MPAPTKFLIRLAWAALLLGNEAAWTQQLPDQALTLESLPRPGTPPPERGTVVPSQVERWRKEGGVHPADTRDFEWSAAEH